MSDVYRLSKINFFAKLFLGNKDRPVRQATFSDENWVTTHWRGKRKQAGPRRNWFYCTRLEIWALSGSALPFDETSDEHWERFYKTCETILEDEAWFKETITHLDERLELIQCIT